MKNFKDLNPKKIAVFRALQLGDMMCIIPAIRALKKKLPKAKIILIGLPWAKEFSDRFSGYFSGFISFPGYPGLPEQKYNGKDFANFMKTVLDEKFDLIIQMQGNGSIVNPMIQSLGARYTAGFYTPRDYCPDPTTYMIYPDNISEVDRHLSLMKYLGIKSKSKYLEFPLLPQEESNFSFFNKYQLVKKKYVIIHPGASDVRKRWSVKRFAQIADTINELGYKVVITGIRGEYKIASELKKLSKSNVINLAGKTTLPELTFLIKNAKMLFSNDTGVSHLADAVKTTSIIIFLSTDPKRWAPLNKKLHHVVLATEAKNIKNLKNKTKRILSMNIWQN